MRIGYIVVKVALDELFAIPIGGFNEIFRLSLRTLPSFHDTFNPLLDGRNDTHRQPKLSRQDKPRAAAHDDSAFMLGCEQHDFTKSADVFRLRYKLPFQPLAEHFMKP